MTASMPDEDEAARDRESRIAAATAICFAIAFRCMSPYTSSTPPAITATIESVKSVSRNVADGARDSFDPLGTEPVAATATTRDEHEDDQRR